MFLVRILSFRERTKFRQSVLFAPVLASKTIINTGGGMFPAILLSHNVITATVFIPNRGLTYKYIDIIPHL